MMATKIDDAEKISQLVSTLTDESLQLQFKEHIAGVQLKIEAAEYRLKKLRREVRRYLDREIIMQKDDKWREREVKSRFPYIVEFDHFVICLRSTLDYLAQIINISCELKMTPRVGLGEPPFASFHEVFKKLQNSKIYPDLSELFHEVNDSSWYEYLNSLRIDAVHRKPIFIIREGGLAPQNQSTSVQPEGKKRINSDIRIRMTKLLLPDEPLGRHADNEMELLSYCEETLNNVRATIQKGYSLLLPIMTTLAGEECKE